MNVEAETPVPVIPVNYSNREVAAHIRHYYPNLQGALRTLLDRFEGNMDCIATVEELKQMDNSVTCPHCGSILHVNLGLGL